MDDDDFDFDMGMDIDDESQKNEEFEDQENDGMDKKKELMEKYKRIQQESKMLDEAARQVRTMMLICKQMEQCYSKRKIDKIVPGNMIEMKYLHDGSVLLIITIENVTDQIMDSWNLTIRWESVYKTEHIANVSQSVQLGVLNPKTSKSFQIEISKESCDLPILFHLALIKEFRMDDIRKVFRVDLDPICMTMWNMVQISAIKKSILANFNFTLRLPHSLIDLLCGCPDTVSPLNVFKSLLSPSLYEKIDNGVNEISLTIPTCSSLWQMINLKVTKESAFYSLNVVCENSKMHMLLKDHLQIWLIIEMSKLNSRPANAMGILPELGNVDELFDSIIASFS